jgi:hypothetical protein
MRLADELRQIERHIIQSEITCQRQRTENLEATGGDVAFSPSQRDFR